MFLDLEHQWLIRIPSFVLNIPPLLLLLHFYTDISVKFSAEQAAKQEAVLRYEKAEHLASMLQLDLKNSQDEVTILKADMKTAIAKVRWTPLLLNMWGWRGWGMLLLQ